MQSKKRLMIESDVTISPCASNKFDACSYIEGTPVPISIAKLWNKYIPRGKSWFPRYLGWLFQNYLKKYYIKTKYGARLAIEPSSLDVYIHILNNGRTWNEHVLDACKTFFNSGGVFYDIGANVGYMSMEMANIFEDKISVISFEPQPLLARIIIISAKLNKLSNVKVFDIILGDTNGEANLHIGSHSIHASLIPREKKYKILKRKIFSIDDLIETNSIPAPDLIKIDIEGGELTVLTGAKKTIDSYGPIIIFESDNNMVRFGYTRKDIIELIKTVRPYNFFYIDNYQKKYIELNNNNISLEYSDILAVPK